jgi:prophage maintenance system killer protein
MAKTLVPVDEQAVFIVPNDGAEIDVRIASQTVWLGQAQIAKLFGVTRENINTHLANIYREGELDEKATCKENLQVRTEGGRQVRRKTLAYDLDAIISVGYRVNSKTATAFRQWATRILKQHLVRDYKNRAQEAGTLLAGVKNIELLARSADAEDQSDAAAVLTLIEKYARSWQLLLEYDENKLPPAPTLPAAKKMARLTFLQASKAIDRFRKSLAERDQATALFGRDRSGDGLASILGNLEQTWGGAPVYPNVEGRAAHLLYFVIKNHPFLDGNKRIGSLLFLHYLDKNRRPLLDENALVALALLIAESDPRHKEIVIKLIISLMGSHGRPHQG